MPFSTILTCALFGDIGGGELLVVFTAILLLFGGKRLPSMARQMSRMVEELRKASQDFKHQLLNADKEVDDLMSEPQSLVHRQDGTRPTEPPPKEPTPRDVEG